MVDRRVDYTVVGGGIAGLVIARRLGNAGRSVRLLERTGRLGGAVAAHTVGGIELDAGAESFATRRGTVAALAADLGLGDRVAAPSREGAWLQSSTGRAVALPATSLLGIPATPLAADVISVIGLRSALRAQLDAVIPSLYAGKSLTLGDLVRRRMGNGVLEKLVAPIVHGVHSMHPDELPVDRAPGLRAALALEGSLAAAVRSLRASAPGGAAAAGIVGGMHQLVAALAADLAALDVDIRLGARVDSLDIPGHVVLAAPWGDAVGRRIVLATLVVDAPELDAAPRGTGVLVAEGAPGISARALTHSTAKWNWLKDRAGGKHVLRLSYDDEPERLAETARADAAALTGVALSADAVVDFARVEWVRPAASTGLGIADDVTVVGEPVAGSGLAGIIADANAKADALLAAS